MEENKDIRLTVVGLAEEDRELKLNFAALKSAAKRSLALWVCYAMLFGALTLALGMVLQKVFQKEEIKALVSFSEDNGYDIRKIKSPTVVQDVLTELGLDLSNTEEIRNAISINGIIPEKAFDQMSMYYNILSQSGTNANTTVQSLLNADYHLSRYIVSFRYASAGLDRDEGVDFLNALLRAYQDYFAVNYNYNMAMGNSLSAIDYTEYDYAEAVNIFSTALDNVTDYLSAVESSATAPFRSTETGFTFEDLRRMAETLRDVDLDWISSYIIIHSVSANDATTEVAYYEWMIDNLTRQRVIQRSQFASLTDSIATYEKDPVLIAVQDGNSVVADMEDLNAYYDDMISEKLDTQASIASYSRSISYYERVIHGFQNAAVSTPEEIEKVEQYLSSLNEKLNTLIINASRTVNEYYERMAFANRLMVLIPATIEAKPLISTWTLAATFIVEFFIALSFLSIVFLKGLTKNSSKVNPS